MPTTHITIRDAHFPTWRRTANNCKISGQSGPYFISSVDRYTRRNSRVELCMHTYPGVVVIGTFRSFDEARAAAEIHTMVSDKGVSK